MTLIAVAHGLVITDSTRATVDGYEFKPGKVTTYSKPVLMRSNRHKFKDWFFGFSGTGEDQIIHQAGISALSSQLDLLTDRYKLVDELRYITNVTTFTLVLFGLNGVAILHANSGDVRLEYVHYGSAGHAAFGSGAEAFARLFKEYNLKICPVRAAYGTFTMEPTCGGSVDVWALPTESRGPNARLRLLKTFEPKSLSECFRMMSSPSKMLFQEESKKWITSLIQRSLKSSKLLSKAKTSPPLPKQPVSPSKSSKKLKPARTSRRSRKSTALPKA